jgi:hypothetical protein
MTEASPQEHRAIPPLRTFGGTGTLPGVDLSSNQALRDLMDGLSSAEALRWRHPLDER